MFLDYRCNHLAENADYNLSISVYLNYFFLKRISSKDILYSKG